MSNVKTNGEKGSFLRKMHNFRWIRKNIHPCLRLNQAPSISCQSLTYPLGDQVLHPLGHAVSELGEVLGGERLADLDPVLVAGEVEE